MCIRDSSEAFYDNWHLKSIILPLSLKEIRSFAFGSLSSITWKHFPESIGSYIFYGNELLTFHVSENSDNCILAVSYTHLEINIKLRYFIIDNSLYNRIMI